VEDSFGRASSAVGRQTQGRSDHGLGRFVEIETTPVAPSQFGSKWAAMYKRTRQFNADEGAGFRIASRARRSLARMTSALVVHAKRFGRHCDVQDSREPQSRCATNGIALGVMGHRRRAAPCSGASLLN
jgi:hypothetical protein